MYIYIHLHSKVHIPGSIFKLSGAKNRPEPKPKIRMTQLIYDNIATHFVVVYLLTCGFDQIREVDKHKIAALVTSYG